MSIIAVSEATAKVPAAASAAVAAGITGDAIATGVAAPELLCSNTFSATSSGLIGPELWQAVKAKLLNSKIAHKRCMI